MERCGNERKMINKFPGRKWNQNYLNKLINNVQSGSHAKAKIKTLRTDASMFIKHFMNDITKNEVTNI